MSTHNARARSQALDAASITTPVVPAVSYRSRGQVLITGPASRVHPAGQALSACAELHPVLMITDSAQQPGTMEDINGLRCVYGRLNGLEGYLGNFILQTDQDLLATAVKLLLPADRPAFDLVLDLSDKPLIRSEIPPPGYYAPGRKDSALQAALEEIPTLVGDFEKPRYFRYNAAICAHGRSGVSGCTRCIRTCPTDAITSNGDVIEVNPNLCQGAGSCATACPTGAIRYAYPSAETTLQHWRSLLKAYRDAGGVHPVLLVHDAESGRDLVAAGFDKLADNVLPVEVEELGSVGMDAWLAALAWGADAVKLLSTPAVPSSVLKEVDFQLSIAGTLVSGLGYAGDSLVRLSPGELGVTGDVASGTVAQPPATFAPLDEKRTLMGLAIDHLAAQAPPSLESVVLPAGAPFGEIQIDAGRCTLCMACVSQCPAGALSAGQERPQLQFVEANCVQCGLCSSSCPEQAISLSSRFLIDAGQRRQMRTLNEDAPFCCIRCNKPFATRSVIERITDKMKDHPMFSGDALERLKMCEDCRVKAMYLEQTGGASDLRSGDRE